MSDNTYSTEHPHGPADPRWIDNEGRCVLCGRDIAESERDLLLQKNAWLLSRVARLENKGGDMNEKPDNSIEAMAVIEAARRMHTGMLGFAYSQHVAHFSAALKAYDEKYPPAPAQFGGSTPPARVP